MALSREDWAEAGLEMLAREGLAGVAVEPLARVLGTTKGSFYWHFHNRRELIEAIVALWERRETSDVIAGLGTITDPGERLLALGRRAYSHAAEGTAHPALLAASADPAVGPVLRRVTGARLRLLGALYEELGLSPVEAADYARLAYALYLGIEELRRTTGAAPAELEPLLELALRRTLPAHGLEQASKR